MRFINRVLDLIVIIAGGLLVIDVLWQVITRYVSRTPSVWTVELAQILFIWVCLLGAVVVLRERGHFDVDVLVKLLPLHVQKYFTLFNDIIVLSFLIVLFWAGIKFCIIGKARTSPVLGIRMHWVYLVIPLTCVLMVFYLLPQILKSFQNNPEQTLRSLDHKQDSSRLTK